MNNSETTIHAGIEQLYKWMLEGGNQVIHCWSGGLQRNTGEKNDLCGMDSVGDINMNLCLAYTTTDGYIQKYLLVCVQTQINVYTFLPLLY
jgi:hypothetical protein